MTRSKTITSATLILLAAMMLSSFSNRKTPDTNPFIHKKLPGVLKVHGTLFCDKIEIPNVAWREYSYWTLKVFGANSEEYKASLPDTLVWNALDSTASAYVTHYYRHFAYNYYPVVGVSQKQAESFSKWRSDRVMERLLIDSKKLKEHDTLSRENYFTMERYFSGKIEERVLGEKVNYYPEFRLPNRDERKYIMQLTDSIYRKHTATFKNKQCIANHGYIIAQNSSSAKINNRKDLTVSVYSSFMHTNKNTITNLRGNVSEWASEPNISFGGGWHNNSSQILQSDTFIVIKPNAWTGFRNICTWKKWEHEIKK